MIDIKIEGDLVVFYKGNACVYDISLHDCSNPAEFLDWILQLNNKTWCTPELLVEFINTIEKLCMKRMKNSAQGCFCPGGVYKDFKWE